MHTRTGLTVVLLALAAATGCSATDDGPKPSTASALPTTTTPASPPSATPPTAATTLALGTPAQTVGSGGTGRLELTPATVVYAPASVGTKPEHDRFAFITIKAKAMTAVAAEQVAPISGGGWKWVTPEGQALDEGNGESYNVVADSFNSGGPIQPGTFVWDGIAFDLTKAQQGGTLLYTDGNGTTYRWKMPATDVGPQAGQVRKELSS